MYRSLINQVQNLNFTNYEKNVLQQIEGSRKSGGY